MTVGRDLRRTAVVLAKVGDGLVVGCKPPKQPHHFQIAMALALQPPARLHTIKIAIDIELEVDRGMIPRPSNVQRLDRIEAQFLQIKPIDKRIDDANRIVLADPVIEASRQQRKLPRSASSINPAAADSAGES